MGVTLPLGKYSVLNGIYTRTPTGWRARIEPLTAGARGPDGEELPVVTAEGDTADEVFRAVLGQWMWLFEGLEPSEQEAVQSAYALYDEEPIPSTVPWPPEGDEYRSIDAIPPETLARLRARRSESP